MKKIIYIIIAATFLIIVLIYFGFWGLSYPRCSEREKSLKIPEYLKNVNIRFEQPMMYLQYSTNKNQSPKDLSCTDAGRISKGYIEPLEYGNEYEKYGYKTDSISADENFQIIKRVYISCPFLTCIDSGDPGEEYLLQNEEGNIWRLPSLYFKNRVSSTRDSKSWNAGYYDFAGKRMGDVVVETK